MNTYELVYLVSPDAAEERQTEIADRLRGHIEQMGGALETLELWEKRRLAYPIQKYREAYYFVVRYSGDGKLVDELERRLRVADNVLRFLTIRLDSALKVESKRKAYVDRKRQSLEKKRSNRDLSGDRPEGLAPRERPRRQEGVDVNE